MKVGKWLHTTGDDIAVKTMGNDVKFINFQLNSICQDADIHHLTYLYAVYSTE